MFHCIPIFSQIFDECRIYDEYLTFCIEIHIDNAPKFPLYMELTFTAGCWVKFCM